MVRLLASLHNYSNNVDPLNLLMIKIFAYLNNCYPRFDSAPEAGESRGLDLILDAHTDLITASSVTKPFQVCNHHQIYMPPLILILS